MAAAVQRVFGLLASVCIAGASIADTISDSQANGAVTTTYEVSGNGTRRFEWATDTGPLWLKVLVEESNLGSSGAEVAEIFFPLGFQGEPHPHELEILYVLEGELGHTVNGVLHILKPGMIGIVKAPDLVIHHSESKQGVRVLVIWPLGKEVKGLEAEVLEDPDAKVVNLRQ